MLVCAVILSVLAALHSGETSPGVLPDQSYDIIIIGLGSAGATAASAMCRAGRRVLALEAQDRIGGRVNTVPFGDGVVEVGAEWIHGTKGSRVYELGISYNLTIVPQNMASKMYWSDGSQANKKVIEDITNVGLGAAEVLPERPGPLGQYIIRRVMEYIQTKYPQLLNDKEFIEEILHYLHVTVNGYHASNNWNDVTTHSKYQELEGSQSLSWNRYGYKTFFEILLNTYNNGPGLPNLDIKLNKEVTQIAWPQDPNADVVVTCKDGTTYRARNVIVTVSLGVLKERHQTLFTPELPQEKISAIQNLTIGTLTKVILGFEEPWWDTSLGVFDFLWRTADRRSIDKEDEWLGMIDGATIPSGSHNTITFWFSGDHAKMVETLPEDELRRKSMEVMKRFMGRNMSIPEPTAMIRSTWHSNPFTRGSYTYDAVDAPTYPYARNTLAQPLRDRSGNPRVLFAGEATDPSHFSTVHGASDSGFREASNLLMQA